MGTVTASVFTVPGIGSGIGFWIAFWTWLDAVLGGGLSREELFNLWYPKQHATHAKPRAAPPHEYASIGNVQVADVMHPHHDAQQWHAQHFEQPEAQHFAQPLPQPHERQQVLQQYRQSHHMYSIHVPQHTQTAPIGARVHAVQNSPFSFAGA